MGVRDAWVVVPAYNEGSVLFDVVRRLRVEFDHVVCVDDGSRDDTGAQALRAGAVVVTHPLNLGQGAALQTGLDLVARRATSGHVVTFDADGQHDVADAVSMLARARETGVDVVLGTRFGGTTSGMSASRRAVLRAGVRFTRATTGLELTDAHNGLRVLRVEALPQVRMTHSGMAHASELLGAIARAGLTWTEAPMSMTYTDYSRAKGQSNLNAFNILFDLATARVRPLS
jgi:glycosyltransferase involved in cell wall biosynthesis